MNIINIPVKDIIPYEKNAKQHDKRQIDNVAESIRQFGFAQPVVVDNDNVLIIGHCRLLAAKKLHMRSVPAVKMSELTEDQVKKLRLLDNKLNESEWDFDLLADDLIDLDFDDFDIDWGIDDQSGNSNSGADDLDDYDDETPVEPRAQKGDLFQLGDHRLLCGDSTNRDDILMLTGGIRVNIALTDPPYGIDVVQNKTVGGDKPVTIGTIGNNNIVKANRYMKVKGDETTDTARLNYELLKEFTENQIIFGGNYFTEFLPPSRCWVVWDKENTGNFADAELAWSSFNRGVKLYHYMWNGLAREGSRDIEGVKRVHPTQKPAGMLMNILNDFTRPNDTVFDPFGGSGSTLIACEQTKRRCYMIEYEPAYIDIIIDRWEKLTGQKAVKGNE